MIVADTNIIAYLLLPDNGFDDVEQLYRLDQKWAAPFLWQGEFRNILALYLRKNLLSFDQLSQIYRQAETLLSDHEYTVSAQRVLELVQQSTCSAYDCEYVALAQHLKIQLVTQDKKVLREFPNHAINIKDYLASH